MRIATANETALANLRLGLVAVNVLAFVLRYVFALLGSRSVFGSRWIIALHFLCTTATIVIWRWFVLIGAPKREAGGIKVGEDLGGKGVIELAWDAVYMTWICTLGSALLGNWVWWLALTVPGIAGFKLFNTVKPLLAMVLPGVFGLKRPATTAAGGQPAQADEPAESRKQAKLRARMEKGDKRVQQMPRK